MKRSLILPLLLAPITACYAAPVAPRKVAKVEKPAPAPAPAPAPQPDPEPIAPEVAAPIVEELLPEDTRCPMAVEGTSVAFVETETGAALMFETPGVSEVQTRLEVIAMDHNKVHPPGDAGTAVAGSEDWGDRDDTIHASGVATLQPSVRLPRVTTPSQATVEVNGTGVRLLYTAEPQLVEKLRDELRAQAIAMASGQCEAPP
jgi:hypothetical protein